MYELIILAQLMRRPAHGYLIAKIVNDIIGPYARISNGRLYPLLAKLELAGFIAFELNSTAGPQRDRQLHIYRITEAGKKRFHHLMMDTTSNPGDYREVFLQKVAYFIFLKPEERLRLIDHYANYCQAHVIHMTNEREDLVENSPSWSEGCDDEVYIKSIIAMMQHVLDQWQLELKWVEELRKKEQMQTREPGQSEEIRYRD